MAGSISYGSMAAAVSRWYAASSTDTAHQGTGQDGSFALGHREEVIDFGDRAVHETILRAKLMIAADHVGVPRVLILEWGRMNRRGRQASSRGGPAVSGRLQRNRVRSACDFFLTHMQAASERSESAGDPQEPRRAQLLFLSFCSIHNAETCRLRRQRRHEGWVSRRIRGFASLHLNISQCKGTGSDPHCPYRCASCCCRALPTAPR